MRRLAERAQLLLSAELGGDARRVDDVVAVHRAAPCLEHRREIQVRYAELVCIREDDLADAAEVELRRELKAVGTAQIGHGDRAYPPRRFRLAGAGGASAPAPRRGPERRAAPPERRRPSRARPPSAHRSAAPAA